MLHRESGTRSRRVGLSPMHRLRAPVCRCRENILSGVSRRSYMQFQCIDGGWKPSTGTDTVFRTKKCWGWLLIPFIGIVPYIICCSIHGCPSKAEPKPSIPPKYTSSSCPPPEVKKHYIADMKHTTVKVRWSDPVATDDERIDSNEQTCCGLKGGDEFPGDANYGRRHHVTYTATDNLGLSASCSFNFTVEYLSCTEPVIPVNGYKKFCPEGYLYGGQCTFECNVGYRMIGSNTITCNRNKTWSSIPSCQKKQCDPPMTIGNGTVTCDDPSYSYDEDCNLICNNGFRLSGPMKMTCQANQTWSVQATDVECIDDEAPVIKCKSPQVFYADQGRFDTKVRWEEPTATDNVDSSPVIEKLTGPSQDDILSEGFYYVQYKATDSQGNSHTTLEVKVIECSTGPMDALEDSRFMTYNCSDKSFYYGVSCNLSCLLNLPLNGTELIACERSGTTNRGLWNWGSGTQPFCQVVKCPPLGRPANGAYITDSINSRPLHVMFCQKGYDIPSVTSSTGSLFTGRLWCQDSGNWYPLDEFPDCIVSVLPWLSLPAELYYEGDCNNKVTKEQIKQQALVYIDRVQDDIDRSICPNHNTCKVENVVVFCGTTSGRKRRQIERHDIVKRQTRYALVTWNIKIFFDKGNKTVQSAYLDFLDILGQIKTTIQDNVDNGTFDIPGFTIPGDGFQTAKTPVLACDSGYKWDPGTVVCKPCPVGTFLNSSTNNCEYCKVGTYMDHEGALSCYHCPEGYSTLNTGTKHVEKCIKLCAPGFFSSSGMEPCFVCPLGTYQSDTGQTSCQECPPGTSASGTNSTSSQDCHSFDIFVSQIPQRTLIASFSTGDATVVSASLWLKPQSNNNGWSSSLYFSDSNGEILTFSATDVIEVVAGSSSPVRTSSDVSSERWIHVIATVDFSSRRLQVFTDGKIVVNHFHRC